MKKFSKRIKLPEMAKLLSRSAKQFRRDVINHKIPHLRLGRTKLFDLDEVVEFLVKQTKEFTPISTTPELKFKNNSYEDEIRSASSGDRQENYYKSLLGLE